ncbi:MAG TPA: SAM-dependent chlorinase/fluorinase, partial [Stellaceae bacterium]|nr:SAM-dependent chlorinase/fluorinase [Stellaceae bacterium]
GLAGPYTGQMKAVLRREAPESEIIDLFADAPTGNPRASAYLLAAYAAWFPAGAIFLCVVDPGVGSDRAPLMIEADRRWFVGPENGLFELVLRRAKTAHCFEITWHPPLLSASFHGRDLFAPVAAMLARGERPSLRNCDAIRQSAWPDDLAEIVYVDHYGNAMTGLRGSALPTDATLILGDKTRVIHAATFSAVPEGQAFWYENSNGLVEIAVNRGRAADRLHLDIGSIFAIER